MRSPIETEIVQFLSNNENVQSVLQILSRRDDIRQACFNHFWSRVLDALLKSRPSSIPDSVLTLELRESNWQFGGVNAFFTGFRRGATQLFYTFEHVIWDKSKAEFAEIYYGLHWVGQVTESSPIQQLSEVIALREDQKKRQFVFDRNPEFHGWKYLGEGKIQPETFLLQLHGPGGESQVAQMVEEFWNYIALTHCQVLATNRSIQSTVKV